MSTDASGPLLLAPGSGTPVRAMGAPVLDLVLVLGLIEVSAACPSTGGVGARHPGRSFGHEYRC